MRIVYLTNKYPLLSHSFIRREIAAVEARGVEVVRVSIRDVGEQVDPDDIAERQRTHVILRDKRALLGATVRAALRRPGRWLSALRLAIACGRRCDRGVLRHIVYLAEACALQRLAQRHDAEHVHAHFGTNPAAVAMLCHRLGGPAYSFTVHGPEEFDRPDALSLGVKITHARFVAAVSSFGRSQLMRWCEREHWPRLHVVRCGLGGDYVEPEPEPVPDVPRLVCVGRLCEQKGQLLLVDAAAQVMQDHPELELALIGDGPMRGAIERRIDELGLRCRVWLLGAMSNAEVRRQLCQARAMILPSFAEGLPVVIMEALALGRPVVSTYVAGIPELLENQQTGWLVPAGDVDALAQAIRQVLTTAPGTLTAMGRAGVERVRRRHDVRREAATLCRLIGHESPAGEQPTETETPTLASQR